MADDARRLARVRNLSIGVGALIVIGCCSGIGGCGGPDGGQDESGSARRVCEDFVRDRLKAPASADFSGLFDTEITRDGDAYTVAGTVDAQNSFGVKLRYRFDCNVELSGGDWTLVDLDISE